MHKPRAQTATHFAAMLAASQFPLESSISTFQHRHCIGISPPSASMLCTHLSSASRAIAQFRSCRARWWFRRCFSSSSTFFCSCSAASFFGSIDSADRRVESAGAVEPVESWQRARRTSVLGDGEADCNEAACWQSVSAGLNRFSDMYAAARFVR